MAVPPTHDGSVGPRSTSGSTVLPVVAAVLAVVCVASLVVLGVRFGDTSGSLGDRTQQLFGAGDSEVAGEVDDPRTRELVLSQANQFVIRVNSYGPSDLDDQSKMPGYVTRVKEVITPRFDVEFGESVTLAEQTVAGSGLKRSAQLYSSGLETIGPDSATVLVTGVITQSYPDPKKSGRIEFEPELFRYEVSMVRTGDSWLADNFVPVVGEVAGEPTPGNPTDPAVPPVDPSAAPSADPSPAVARYARLVAGREADVREAAAAVEACGFPAAGRAGSAACAAAVDDLGAAARVLSAALRDAGDPDADLYVAPVPDAIDDLVGVTRVVANDVVAARSALQPICVTSASAACSAQRKAVTDSATNLVSALDGWGAVG